MGECTGCHQPVRGNDYVYTEPITAVEVPGEEVVNNRAAALGSLSYEPLGWNTITMFVDPKTHMMATLYGNGMAAQAVRARGQAGGAPAYPAGGALALVTWEQRDAPHWFGARIPNSLRSVEFVQVASKGHTNSYQRFSGSASSEDHPPATTEAERTTFVMRLAPAQLP